MELCMIQLISYLKINKTWPTDMVESFIMNSTHETKRTIRRRTKLEIYHDIINSIMDAGYGTITVTKVQLYTKLSYDKFSRHLANLEEKKMITTNPLQLTDKAREFLNEYDRMKEFIDKWI